MKTAISIPGPLFEAAERLARRLKIPRSQLYSRAVDEYLKRHRPSDLKEALDAIYGSETSLLDPVLEANRVPAESRNSRSRLPPELTIPPVPAV